MTYDARERSIQDGAPVELYEFARGENVQRYTSADREIQLVELYAPATLKRSQIEASAERARNSLRISCARDFPIAELFRVTPPGDVVGVTVKRVHRGETDVAVIWMGRVLNCEWSGAVASLNCEPVSASLRRTGLRRKYSRQCQHVLYSAGAGACNVSKLDHQVIAEVVSVDGKTIEVDALGTDPYPGGFVEWTMPSGAVERRFIASVSGLEMVLSQPFYGMAAGDSVTILPGCDHTRATCDNVYSNSDNYGGFPFVPRKNPFDGTPVF